MKSISSHDFLQGRARHDQTWKAGVALQRVIRVMRNHLRDQRQYRELEQLPDYLLDDVGLTRADIERHRRGY